MFNLHIVSRLIEEGKLPTAISLLNEISKKVPAYVTPYVMLANIYETVGNKQGALTSWRSAQRLVPGSRLIKQGVRRNQTMSLPPVEGFVEEPNLGSTLVRELVAVPDDEHEDLGYTEDLIFDTTEEPMLVDSLSGESSSEGEILDYVEEEEIDLDGMVDEFFEDMSSSTDSLRSSVTFVSPDIESDLTDEEDIDQEDKGDPDILVDSRIKEEEAAELDRLIEELQEVSNIGDSRSSDSQPDLKPELDSVENFQENSKDDMVGDLNQVDELEMIEEKIEETSSEKSFLSPLPTDLDASILDLEGDLPVGESEGNDLLRQDDVVSETLARIYISQKKYSEAAKVYKILADQNPERAGAFKERAKELRVMAAEAED